MVDEERYNRAKKRVKGIKDFYIHLIVYLVVSIFFLVLNLLTSPDSIWFYWPLLGWGIGLLFHASSVFFFKGLFGEDWEERKIKEIMEKEKQDEGK